MGTWWNNGQQLTMYKKVKGFFSRGASHGHFGIMSLED
jgi:hypothetical protein